MNQSYLRKIGLRMIVKKRQRTSLCVSTTIISTIVVVTSLLLFWGVFSIKETKHLQVDPFHFYVTTNENIDFPKRYRVCKEAVVDENVFALSSTDNYYPLNLVEGKMATTEDELVVPSGKGKIGDVIKGYTVVGIYDNNDIDKSFTYLDKSEIHAYYLLDELVHNENSKSDLMSHYQFQEDQIIFNKIAASQEAVSKYLVNEEFLFGVFALVIMICIVIMMIAINNIFVVSDASRKKELGLLKTVGCSPTGIRYLIMFELFVLGLIGSLLGGVFGFGLSYFIFNNICKELFLSLSFFRIETVVLTIIGGCISWLFFIFSGYFTYKKYIDSIVVDDLKESVNYIELPYKDSRKIKHSFSWKMFCIYNRRMKKQTKNMLVSFCLVLMVGILFLTSFLISGSFMAKYESQESDFVLKSEGVTNNTLMQVIADYDFELEFENFEIDRFIDAKFYTPKNFYKKSMVEKYVPMDIQNAKVHHKASGNSDYCYHVFYYPLFMNASQIVEFEPYLIKGNFEDLEYNSIIAILSESDPMGMEFCENMELTGEFIIHKGTAKNHVDVDFPSALSLGWGEWRSDHTEGIVASADEFHISAIVCLPDEAYEKFLFNFKDYPRVFVLNADAYIDNNIPYFCNDTVKFKLEKKSDVTLLQMKIEDLLQKYQSFDSHSYVNYALTILENEKIMFILEWLLIPLFILLFVVSSMNIYFVLTGNLLLRSRDVSILKALGSTKKQLRNMFIYDYCESYINATLIIGLLASCITLFIYYLVPKNVLNIGLNFMGGYILSAFIIVPIIVVFLVILHLKFLNQISMLQSERVEF